MGTNAAFVTEPAHGLSGLESRVLAALQKLLALCLQAPGVDLIDTGPDPGTGSMALQVHVRNPRAGSAWVRSTPSTASPCA